MKDLDRVLLAQDGERVWDVGYLTELPNPLFGEVTNTTTSHEEKVVGDHLRSVGFDPRKVSVMLPRLIAVENGAVPGFWKGHPDFFIGSKIVVEVDHPPIYEATAWGHVHGWPRIDLYRNDCYRSLGFSVVRLRMGGLSSVPGSFNVLSPESIISNTTLEAVTKAVASAMMGYTPYDYTVPPPVNFFTVVGNNAGNQ